MQGNIRRKLLHYKRKTISLTELEKLAAMKSPSYPDFAKKIAELEKEGILEMVKSRGRNQHSPSLAYHYKINKALLNKEYHTELQSYRLKFHPKINLDPYFSLDPAIWGRDVAYLEKIDYYLNTYGFPKEEVPAPERSFELVQDEKWLVEGKGSDVLVRIGLWEDLKILPVSDPLMFAIHPERMEATHHLHLIVENKTTYQALLPELTSTNFTTLIYGSGNKITKSMENFHHQLPIEGEHHFYYFGDVDQSGITIWYTLNNRTKVIPAYPFYLACLQKNAVFGKTNQRPNEVALEKFLQFFSRNVQEKIRTVLHQGAYYPQEILKTRELQQIWREAEWKI
jgi:hypothetical protein